MAGYHGVSDYTKTASMVLVLTTFIHIVAFGAPYWTTRHNGNAGLWTGCSDGVCYERWNQWVARWIKVTQTCMVLSLITLVAANICLFLYMLHKEFMEDKRLIFVSCITSFLSAFFTFIGVLNWAANEYFGQDETLNWPFALACASSLSSSITAIFLFIELRPSKIGL